MTEPQIRFDDGAAYENFMGVWSRSVGEVFLEWLSAPKGLAWLDVGCGNGAFTELLVERVAPSLILGVDPSDAQLDYARKRHTAGIAEFVKGDAMALSVADGSFDAAVMALVIFFVPQPPRGVAEMVRAVKPGGQISAYAWDLLGGGFPLHVFHEELLVLGLPSPLPPNPEASRLDNLEALWRDAGITGIATTAITVERTFPDFEALWAVNLSGPRLSAVSSAMTPEQRMALKTNVRARLTPDGQGRFTTTARAHAIKGRTAG